MSDQKVRIGGKPPRWDEELRSWLEGYLNRYPHHTLEVLSRSQYIGAPRAALESYLEGLYFLPKESGGEGNNTRNSEIEPLIRAYRERVEGTSRHGYANTFVETRSWMQLMHACETAINEHVIVIVYGKPGVGKSRCLTEFGLRRMTTAPIQVLCSRNITALYFAQKLATELNLDDRLPLARLEDLVAEKLKRYPRPLFIDQANYLPERSLGTVCHIWEIARVPIVLVGTKELYNLFMNSRMTEDVRAQISSRVAMHYLLSELSLAEAKAILKRGLGEDATDEAIAQIYRVTGGIHRHVDMIIPRIRQLKSLNQEKLASGEVKMADIITAAGSKLMAGV
jgi:DNA transposition AAA+ family ATPase